MDEKIEFISEGHYFFPNIVFCLVLLTVKSYNVLQAASHSSQPVSKVGGSLKFCLENILSPESYTKLLFDLNFHRKNSDILC